MSIRGKRRIVCVAGPAILLTIVTCIYFTHALTTFGSRVATWTNNASTRDLYKQTTDFFQYNGPKPHRNDYYAEQISWDVSGTHRELFSVSTKDKRYFPIKFGHLEAINPNIIPHPFLDDAWIIVAQQGVSSAPFSIWFAEISCPAVFVDDVLQCIEPPMTVPIPATYSTHCSDSLSFFQTSIGPHDARVGYGPKAPYIVYGSQSSYNCFGQWVQDFRMLYDWGFDSIFEFKRATELQRPPPFQIVEKNWFLFWDPAGNIYIHYDVYPDRVFSKIELDGTAGPNLASLSYPSDRKCMDIYMPSLSSQLESIHQATNSLSITLCSRYDSACTPNEANTFIMSIFQHKNYWWFHSTYEPYVMLFRQTSPFKLHAISEKPLWIHGRGKWRGHANAKLTEEEIGNTTEMVYVTSINWKEKGKRYHGYIDDVVFLAFGIEDERTAGIDVVAGELVKDLGICVH